MIKNTGGERVKITVELVVRKIQMKTKIIITCKQTNKTILTHYSNAACMGIS